MVHSDGGARFTYLQALSSDPSYQALLRALEAKACIICCSRCYAKANVRLQLQEPAVIRVKSPVMWATWGLKAAHVPKSILTSVKNVTTLMNWVERGKDCAGGASDVQRYCLVVGLLLSDLDFIERTPGDVPWPEDLPEYLAYSQIDDAHRTILTRSCEAQAAEHGGLEVDVVVPSLPGAAIPNDGTAVEGLTMDRVQEVPRRVQSMRKTAAQLPAPSTTVSNIAEGSGTGGRRTCSHACRG